MAKQILEIEVPDGKKAVWKDGYIVFEDVDNMENIKTIDDAILFLVREKIGNDILNTLSKLSKNSFEWKIAAYRAVVMAITHNEQRHLTTGERWFPTIEFCRPGKLKNCYGNIVVGRIESEGEKFYVVGGNVIYGSSLGLGSFYSGKSVSCTWSDVGLRSVGSKKAALYISKQFGKLLFEISYGGINCDWKWV